MAEPPRFTFGLSQLGFQRATWVVTLIAIGWIIAGLRWLAC